MQYNENDPDWVTFGKIFLLSFGLPVATFLIFLMSLLNKEKAWEHLHELEDILKNYKDEEHG